MKTAILTAVAAGLLGLTGCSSDTVKNSDVPAPAPQDSGITGPPPKGKEGGGRVPVAPKDKTK